jgi:PAS domain S-box-containing protein
VSAAGSGPDLTERVAELERERELLNAIANTAPSLLCLIDPDGTVRPMATNKAFERVLGYEPSETGGVKFWERYVPPEDAAAVQRAIEHVVHGALPEERDGRWVTRTGEAVDVVWSCTPLPMIASGPLYLICGTDITDRKQHEEEVRTSRARIVAAADDARKQIERNLHDGAQQRLVVLLLSLRNLRARPDLDQALSAGLDAAIQEATAALSDLRELARGIHPAMLHRGLAAALRPVARRAPLEVTLDVGEARYLPQVEATAYYVALEALTNVAKYSGASKATVSARASDGLLLVEVRDDGVGGADATRGTGLRGLLDRVAALDGTLEVESPPGGGTRVRARIPLT